MRTSVGIIMLLTVLSATAIPGITKGAGGGDGSHAISKIMEGSNSANIDAIRLEIEQARLAQEAQRLALERQSSYVNAIGIILPLVVATITLIVGVWNRYRQDKLIFQTKAAEIVMDANGPDAALNRAKALVSLFPEHLPEDFTTSFNPENFFNPEAFENKIKFFEVVAPHIDNKKELSVLWGQLFPKDKWRDRIK